MSEPNDSVEDGPVITLSSMDTTKSSPTHTRSQCFYYDTVTFLVEGVLYKVPRDPFNESPIFLDMFSLPTGAPGGVVVTPEGLLDHSPITLMDIDKGDFESLLAFITPQLPTVLSIGRTKSFPKRHCLWKVVPNLNQLTSVMKLSRLWLMKAVHEAARAIVLNISTGSSVSQRVLIAREYSFPQLLQKCCQELVDREPPISLEEATCLGLSTTFELIKLREERLRLSAAAHPTAPPAPEKATSKYGKSSNLSFFERADVHQDKGSSVDVIEVEQERRAAAVVRLLSDELASMRTEYARLFEHRSAKAVSAEAVDDIT